jgi:hypothetical protein
MNNKYVQIKTLIVEKEHKGKYQLYLSSRNQ